MKSKKTYRIGCSGYYYPSWKNIFYPKMLQPKDWLNYYSSVFNSVEMNGTFYRTPKLLDLKKNALATPDDFKFSVKMNKFITHNKKLLDCKDEIITFQDLIYEGLEEKLACFLFQMPPSFQYSDENLERIINNVPHLPNNVIELRHISWWNKDVQKTFKKLNLTFCNVDYPGLETYIINTSEVFYFRFHGNPELFKSSYDLSILNKYHQQFPDTCKEYNIYFNNTATDAGFSNAMQLKKIIENA